MLRKERKGELAEARLAFEHRLLAELSLRDVAIDPERAERVIAFGGAGNTANRAAAQRGSPQAASTKAAMAATATATYKERADKANSPLVYRSGSDFQRFAHTSVSRP